MSNCNAHGKELSGVGCDAVNCEYQSGGCCHADYINVKSPSAVKKAETFCSTFKMKTE